MNRTRWSLFTLLAVCLLIAVSSTRGVTDAEAYPYNFDPYISSASAIVDGDYVVITGVAIGDRDTLQIEDLESAITSGVNMYWQFTITVPDTGSTAAYIQPMDINGIGDPVAVFIEMEGMY